MLMTKFKFDVNIIDRVAHTTITRLKDNAQKTFTHVGVDSPDPMIYFMSFVTDDLAESYFPRNKK